jgi:hypothetical protein
MTRLLVGSRGASGQNVEDLGSGAQALKLQSHIHSREWN